MASLIKTTTILAVVILGTAAEPALKRASRNAGPKSDGGMVENHVSLSQDGFLALEAKLDVHILLDLLRQIPFLKDTVLQLVQEVKTLESKSPSGLKLELERMKTEVMRGVNIAESNIEAAVDQSRDEALKRIAMLLQSMSDSRANITSTMSQTVIEETSSQVLKSLSTNNKNLEKFITKLINSEITEVKRMLENNTHLLNDIEGIIHGDKGSAFGSGACDLESIADEINKETVEVKGAISNLPNEFSNRIEIALKVEREFYDRRLDSLDAMVKEALKGIALLVNKTEEIAAQQLEYFNSAVEEQVEMVKVVKKTQHFVKAQVETANKAAARIEKVAARTLAAGRGLGCQSSNKLDTNETY